MRGLVGNRGRDSRRNRGLLKAGRQMLRGLRLGGPAEVLVLIIVAVARLEVDRLVLLVAKLGKERVQATALISASRISRHG